jgi:hypothetical protein
MADKSSSIKAKNADFTGRGVFLESPCLFYWKNDALNLLIAMDGLLFRFLRYITFCIFFAAGTVAIVLSFWVQREMIPYFQSVALLDKTVKDNEKIQSLIDQYNAQNAFIEREPNVLARLQQVALGQTPPPQEGVISPSDYNLQLSALAKQVLEENPPSDPNEFIPLWARRSVDVRYRSALFLSGAGLLLITFMFFGSSQKPKPAKKPFR